DGDAELAGFGLLFALVFVFFAEAGSEQFRTIGDGDRGLLLLAVAHEVQLCLRAGFAGSDVSDQIVAALEFAAIDGGNGVADLQASLVGGAAGNDVRDGHAASVDAGDSGVGLGGGFGADRTASHAMLGADQLVVNLSDRVRRHGEANARIGTGLGQNGGVDSDDFAGHVDERAAGIAGVDGGIGLNEGLELALGNDVAAFGGDDAGGDGFLQAERTADSQHPIANLHAIGVAEFGGGQGVIHLNLNDGEIGFLIHADDFGVVAGGTGRFILQLHANAIGLFDHVTVRHDVALGVDNY